MDNLDNLNSYCYGPVTLNEVTNHSDLLDLTVQGSNLRSHHAVYTDCVYHQIDKDTEGERFLLVEEKSAGDIIAMRKHSCMLTLSQITSSLEKLIGRWQSEGRHFYIHYGDKANKEYLVVAGNLHFD